MGQIDQERRSSPARCLPGMPTRTHGAVRQRPAAFPGADRHDSRLGRSAARRKATEGSAAGAEVRRGLEHRQAGMVLPMPEEFTLEATGPDEYQYFEIPTNFKEDKYVQMAEARPGNRKIVHHIIAFVQPPPKGGEAAAAR